MENLMSNSTCLFAFWFYLKFERQISDNLRYFRYSSIPSVSPKSTKNVVLFLPRPRPLSGPGIGFGLKSEIMTGEPGQAQQTSAKCHQQALIRTGAKNTTLARLQ